MCLRLNRHLSSKEIVCSPLAWIKSHVFQRRRRHSSQGICDTKSRHNGSVLKSVSLEPVGRKWEKSEVRVSSLWKFRSWFAPWKFRLGRSELRHESSGKGPFSFHLNVHRRSWVRSPISLQKIRLTKLHGSTRRSRISTEVPFWRMNHGNSGRKSPFSIEDPSWRKMSHGSDEKKSGTESLVQCPFLAQKARLWRKVWLGKGGKRSNPFASLSLVQRARIWNEIVHSSVRRRGIAVLRSGSTTSTIGTQALFSRVFVAVPAVLVTRGVLRRIRVRGYKNDCNWYMFYFNVRAMWYNSLVVDSSSHIERSFVVFSDE